MIQISEPELHIIELNGFLNAVRCILGIPNRAFGAVLIEKEKKTKEQIFQEIIESDLAESVLELNEDRDFKYIQKLLNKFIYSKLSISVEKLDWNLIEYYGLVSTAEDENGKWNRLVSQNSRVLEYRDGLGNEGAVFFVEHDSFLVMTYLCNL